MKRWLGNVTVELTDVQDGTVETFSETNLVTEAVNDILGQNPMGVLYRAGGQHDEQLLWNGNLLPICPNMIGGILLFGSPIAEAAGNVFLSSANLPVAYASNDVNSTANAKRGSMNQVESMVLSDGFKFVWEFTPSQGNGTIAAVGLTSKQGGMNAFGSDAGVASALLQMSRIGVDGSASYAKELVRTVTVDFANGKLTTLAFENDTVRIDRYRVPVFDLGLNERLDDSTLELEDSTGLLCSTFAFLGIDEEYGIFMDGGDGYWYGFANTGNASGNAVLLWVKISQSDYSYTEGSWSLSNVSLMRVGEVVDDDSYLSVIRSAVVRGGYLYVPAYDRRGLYKINLQNNADVTLINLGFTASFDGIGEQGNLEVRLALIGDLIVGYGFQVDAADRVIRTYEDETCGCVGTPFFQYKEFLFAWGGAYNSFYRYAYLLTPYLATICNLAQPVVKNVDKSMKITYTLREVAV